MGRIRRSRTHKAIKHIKKQFRTRRRTKDLDQIHEEMNDPQKLAKLQEQAIDPDMPGLGQHYCVECSRYFVDATSLEEHLKSKLHKKRVKVLKEQPYTQKDADAAVGLTTQNSRVISTDANNIMSMDIAVA